jgi:hypothetical protein
VSEIERLLRELDDLDRKLITLTNYCEAETLTRPQIGAELRKIRAGELQTLLRLVRALEAR